MKREITVYGPREKKSRQQSDSQFCVDLVTCALFCARFVFRGQLMSDRVYNIYFFYFFFHSSSLWFGVVHGYDDDIKVMDFLAVRMRLLLEFQSAINSYYHFLSLKIARYNMRILCTFRVNKIQRAYGPRKSVFEFMK